ncbi:MAG: hypothetical protein QM760_07540 [Nibricoccus sp.]
MKLLVLASLIVFGATGCSVVSHYAGSSGRKTEKGEVLRCASFEYTVPVSLLRVQTDDDGLVAYEDFGPGMGRGRVFVVRAGPAHEKGSVLEDLRQFGKSPSRALQDGRLVGTHSGEWKGTAVVFHLIEVPEISRSVGEKSKLIDRERVWILGMIVPYSTQRYWISLTSSDEFFNGEEGISERNLDQLLQFADGFRKGAGQTEQITPGSAAPIRG